MKPLVLVGAAAVALLHPVPLALVRSGAAAPPADAAADSGAWMRVAEAIAHVGDALVVALHPASWSVLAAGGEPLVGPLAAAFLVLLAGWTLTIASDCSRARAAWWAGLAFATIAALCPDAHSTIFRASFAAAVAATVFAAVVALVDLASRTRLGRAPVVGVLLLLVASASLSLLPAWQTPERLTRAAVAQAPRRAGVHLAAARSAQARGDSNAELESLRRALSLAPRDARVRGEVGRAYAARASWSEAERHLAAVALERPGDARAAIDAADAAARAGHWTRARSLVHRAAAAFDETVDAGAAAPPVLVELSRRLAERGDFAASARVLAAARSQGQASAGVAREHGQALAAAGRRDEAVRAFRDAVALDGRDADSAIELAWLLATSAQASPGGEASGEAVELANRAVSLSPRDAAAFDTLAVAQAAAGDFAAAILSAEHAIELGRPLGDEKWRAAVTARLEGYRRGAPYREQNGTKAPVGAPSSVDGQAPGL